MAATIAARAPPRSRTASQRGRRRGETSTAFQVQQILHLVHVIPASSGFGGSVWGAADQKNWSWWWWSSAAPLLRWVLTHSELHLRRWEGQRSTPNRQKSVMIPERNDFSDSCQFSTTWKSLKVQARRKPKNSAWVGIIDTFWVINPYLSTNGIKKEYGLFHQEFYKKYQYISIIRS